MKDFLKKIYQRGSATGFLLRIEPNQGTLKDFFVANCSLQKIEVFSFI